MVGRAERRRDLSQPDLAILIVAYNCRDDIDEALASIDEADPALRYEIVVIDNDSSDGIVEHLRDDDRVTVVEMGANTGFSRANNAGIAATSARNILFLNPDTVVRPGALETMVTFLDEHPDAGVVAPKLLNTDLTDQGTARAFPSPAAAIFGRRSPLTRLFPDNPWAKRYMTGRDRVGDDPFPIDWVSGACLMTASARGRRRGPAGRGLLHALGGRRVLPPGEAARVRGVVHAHGARSCTTREAQERAGLSDRSGTSTTERIYTGANITPRHRGILFGT